MIASFYKQYILMISYPNGATLTQETVINYGEGGGGAKWEHSMSELFAHTHPQDRVKLFVSPF